MPCLFVHHLFVIISIVFWLGRLWSGMQHRELNDIDDVSDFDELKFVYFGGEIEARAEMK